MYFNHVTVPLVNRPFVKQLDRTDGHFYLTEQGKVYPSITTVLKIETQEAINKWIAYVGEQEANRIMKESQEAGTAMHSLVEDFLSNKPLRELDLGTTENPKFAYSPYKLFETIKPALADVNNIHALETKLYSDDLGLAGTVDCVAEYEGKLSIIDFKNSRKPKTKSRVKNYMLQVTAYGEMWKQCIGTEIEQGIILISNWDGTTSIFKVKLADHIDNLWKVLLKWETYGI